MIRAVDGLVSVHLELVVILPFYGLVATCLVDKRYNYEVSPVWDNRLVGGFFLSIHFY